MNQYYLLQIYGNPISIEYFECNINENLAYDIATRFPSWRVKIIHGETIELQLIIKKIIATESKIESLKSKMSEHSKVFYRNKDNFTYITNFDQDDIHEYIYEVESSTSSIPESPKNQKKETNTDEQLFEKKKTINKNEFIHALYYLTAIGIISYIINYLL